MGDLAKLFNAAVMPYTAIASVSGIIFMVGTGQEVHMILYGLFFGSLSKMGIHWSITSLLNKGGK